MEFEKSGVINEIEIFLGECAAALTSLEKREKFLTFVDFCNAEILKLEISTEFMHFRREIRNGFLAPRFGFVKLSLNSAELTWDFLFDRAFHFAALDCKRELGFLRNNLSYAISYIAWLDGEIAEEVRGQV